MPSAKGVYVPLLAENQILGAVGLIPEQEDYNFTIAEISQLETFASLIASSLQRAKRANDAENAKVISENEKLRNILLASISHDLRIPLASIVGAISSAMMMKKQFSQEVAHLIDIIHTQSTRLTKLVTNLLDATSLDSGAVPLNKGIYHIEALLKHAYSRTETQKGTRQIIMNVGDDLPDIEMDGLLIEQIVVNLLDNAIKHTEDDTGMIHVNAYEQENHIIVDVLDNGKGIPAGDEEKIFERFYNQAHRPDGSTGLGLNICQTIIVAHGGTMLAFNRPDGGAGFRFSLPYDIAEG
jgi:two-component system, OmpR family, sensor histidine kinase KdpD